MAAIDTIISGLSALGGIGAAVAAYWSYKTGEKANETSTRSLALQTISGLLQEYATTEMHRSLTFLHDEFKGRDRATLRKYYLEIINGTGKAHCEENRRRVSHFFQRMVAIKEAGVLSDDTLFLGWDKQDFAIIDIIVSLEEALAQQVGSDASETVNRLLALKKAGEVSFESRKANKPGAT